MGRIPHRSDLEPPITEDDTQPYEVAPGYIEELPPFMARRGYAVKPLPARTMVETKLHTDPPLKPRRPLALLHDALICAVQAFVFEIRGEWKAPY